MIAGLQAISPITLTKVQMNVATSRATKILIVSSMEERVMAGVS